MSSSASNEESATCGAQNDEVAPSRKRPRPSSNSSKLYVIEWPTIKIGEEDLKLDATVTFLPNISGASNDKLCLMGRAQIQCLEGSITLLGHRLDANSPQKLQIESPPWSSLLVLEPSPATKAVVRVESWWPQSAENHLEATFELVESMAPGVRPTYVPFTWENAMKQILPDLNSTENVKPAVESKEPEPSRENKADSSRDKAFRMAICGAKGVGKSTFLRYATNRILTDTETPQVAILDADVGQPEMSPPGLVTLTVVTDPLLTPPHYRSLAIPLPCHTQQYSYFFGSATSKTDPNRYMQLLQRLIQHYEHDILPKTPKVPLLINLDGWVKGLGFELLSTLLTEILDPLHVVQIVGTTKSKQFELLQVLNPEASRARLHVVYSYNSALNVVSPMPSQTEEPCEQTPNAYTNNDNVILPKVPVSCVMPAQALRALRLCTYFLSDVTIWYNLRFNHEGIRDDTCEIAHRLAGALPYAVPFEAVEIQWEGSDHFADLEGNFDLMLDAINAKIVGLSYRSDRNEEESDDLFSCVGLGLVRAIDRVQRIFYILTPLEPEKLQGVNVLVGGMIEVPSEFWFRGVHAEAFPYQTLAPPYTAVGAEPMKSRNNIGRKGLANGANPG